MNIITKFTTQHPLLSFLLSIFVLASMAIHIPKVKTIEDVDRFVLMDNTDNHFYQEFKKIFGNDEFFVIVFESENIFTKEILKFITDLTSDLEQLELVRKVESLSNVDINIGGDDFFETRKFLETIPETENELMRMRELVVNSPLYVNNFISKSGKATSIVISAYDRPNDEYYRENLIQSVERILKNHNNQANKFHLAGKTITDVTMSRYIDEDFKVLIPASYILITAIILAIYRNIRLTIIAIIIISACLMSTMGFLGLAGITQNSLISIVFPLIMALSLCDIVHIYSALITENTTKIDTKTVKKSLDNVI